MRFFRNDHPAGEKAAHGARWKLSPGERGDNIEVYKTNNTLRISVTDFLFGTNEANHGLVNMDPDSAIEFAEEIIRRANELKNNK